MDLDTSSYILIWRVENLNLCMCIGSFDSPDFNLGTSPGSTFCFNLNTRKNSEWSLSINVSKVINPLFFHVSLYGLSKSLTLTNGNGVLQFKQRTVFNFDRNKLTERNEIFLPNNTLSVRCQIWIYNANFTNNYIIASKLPLNCWTKTTILTVQHFSEKDVKLEFTKEIAFEGKVINILFICDNFKCEDMISLQVKWISYSKGKSLILNLKVSVLDRDSDDEICKESQETVHSNEIWEFPKFISRHKLLSNAALYLPDDELKLQLELSLHDPDSQELSREIQHLELPPKYSNQSGLHQDINNFYKKGEDTDVKLVCGDKEFQAHKLILSIRSPVFDAMFRSNMKENIQNLIEIEDMEPNILEKMLAFIYAEAFEKVSWDDAKKLYASANKYNISSLQNTCGLFFMVNATVDKIAEILTLAEMYQDRKLEKNMKKLKSIYFC